MCISILELNQRVADIRSLKTLKEETENAIKALERDIIDYLAEQEKPEYIGTDYKVTYRPQSRTTLDKEKLEELLDDLSPFEKTTSYNVLRIK